MSTEVIEYLNNMAKDANYVSKDVKFQHGYEMNEVNDYENEVDNNVSLMKPKQQ
jgi:hypothetical protein